MNGRAIASGEVHEELGATYADGGCWCLDLVDTFRALPGDETEGAFHRRNGKARRLLPATHHDVFHGHAGIRPDGYARLILEENFDKACSGRPDHIP